VDCKIEINNYLDKPNLLETIKFEPNKTLQYNLPYIFSRLILTELTPKAFPITSSKAFYTQTTMVKEVGISRITVARCLDLILE
jgi:hypothetical protein